MKIRTTTSVTAERVRFHPYRRPVVHPAGEDKPYKPRIEDKSLLYLAFDIQNLPSKTPAALPLEGEDRLNDHAEDKLRFWKLGLAVFMLIFLQYLFMLIAVQLGGENDGF